MRTLSRETAAALDAGRLPEREFVEVRAVSSSGFWGGRLLKIDDVPPVIDFDVGPNDYIAHIIPLSDLPIRPVGWQDDVALPIDWSEDDEDEDEGGHA